MVVSDVTINYEVIKSAVGSFSQDIADIHEQVTTVYKFDRLSGESTIHWFIRCAT